jgi:hypothetical protein
MRAASVAAFSMILAACSAAVTRPSNVTAAEVDVNLTAPIFFGSLFTAPATFDVTVRNTASVPVNIRHIFLSAPGMAQYAIRAVDKIYNEALAPGETKSFPIMTTAIASSTALRASEPMNVRVEIDFEAAGQHYRDYFFVMNVPP